MKKERCRYCGSTYQRKGKGEHVFPFGLGGQNLYMDCVCSRCNNYFSTLERELLQTSLIGMMRSTEGIQGYKTYENPAPFKAQILLMPGKDNEIIYEVGQFYQMQVFVRPQIILVKGNYYLEANSDEGRTKLSEQYKKWKTENLKMITRMPASKEDTVGYVEFKQNHNQFSSEIKDERIKIKDEIFFDVLPESHNLHSVLTPRLFIDDDDKLRVRAATLNEAIKFMSDFLSLTLTQLVLNSFGGEDIHQPIISVGYSFDAFKLEQALVKIGINCLAHYFPTIKYDHSLNDCISFVMTGLPYIHRETEEKSDIIDSCEHAHNIFFYQGEDTVRIRISLFNGGFIFSFYIPLLKILGSHEYNRLVISYRDRVHTFENKTTFLQSFH